MNYTLEHIKSAFRAASKGFTEDQFLTYLELDAKLKGTAPAIPGSVAKPKADLPPMVYPKARQGKRIKRGQLSEQLLNYLKSKGAEGAHVKDVAAAIGCRPDNVINWLYSTGQKLIDSGELKKIKPRTFSYIPKVQTAVVHTPVATPTQTPAASTVPAPVEASKDTML